MVSAVMRRVGKSISAIAMGFTASFRGAGSWTKAMRLPSGATSKWVAPGSMRGSSNPCLRRDP